MPLPFGPVPGNSLFLGGSERRPVAGRIDLRGLLRRLRSAPQSDSASSSIFPRAPPPRIDQAVTRAHTLVGCRLRQLGQQDTSAIVGDDDLLGRCVGLCRSVSAITHTPASGPLLLLTTPLIVPELSAALTVRPASASAAPPEATSNPAPTA